MNRLDKAVDYLSTHWGKGAVYNRDTGNSCAFGGLLAVHYDNFPLPQGSMVNVIGAESGTPEARILSDVIKENYFDRVESYSPAYSKGPYFVIAEFNDHRDTTWEEVKEVFREASTRLEERT